MMLDGAKPKSIARTFGVPVGVAIAWCAKVRKEWIRNNSREWGLMVAEEVERLRCVEREASKAWRASQEPATVVRTVRRLPDPEAGTGIDDPFEAAVAQPDGELFGTAYTPTDAEKPPKGDGLVTAEQVIEIRPQVGDPRFLAEQRACVDMRLDLLGAYKSDTSVILAGMISADQMRSFANALMRGIEHRVGDPRVVQELKEYVVQSLPASSAVRTEVEDAEVTEAEEAQSNVAEVPADGSSVGVVSVGLGTMSTVGHETLHEGLRTQSETAAPSPAQIKMDEV